MQCLQRGDVTAVTARIAVSACGITTCNSSIPCFSRSLGTTGTDRDLEEPLRAITSVLPMTVMRCNQRHHCIASRAFTTCNKDHQRVKKQASCSPRRRCRYRRDFDVGLQPRVLPRTGRHGRRLYGCREIDKSGLGPAQLQYQR